MEDKDKTTDYEAKQGHKQEAQDSEMWIQHKNPEHQKS